MVLCVRFVTQFRKVLIYRPEFVFDWLQLVQRCPHKCYTRAIHSLIYPDHDDRHTNHYYYSVLAILHHRFGIGTWRYFDDTEARRYSLYSEFTEMDFFCGHMNGCPLYNYQWQWHRLLGQVFPSFPRAVSLAPPSGAKGTLTSERNWPYDFTPECGESAHRHQEGGILRWMALRLEEHILHFSWHNPVAEFPLPRPRLLRLGRVFHGSSSASTCHVFDPRDRGSVSKPWIKLVYCKPPDKSMAELPSSHQKLIAYFYRGSPPGDVLRFPPINCMSSTIMALPEWNDDTIFDVFSVFEHCEVEILAMRNGHHGKYCRRDELCEVQSLKGINGLSVLFLALSDPSVQVSLLSFWKAGKIILDDMARHPIRGWFSEDRPHTDYIFRDDPDTLSVTLSRLFTNACQERVAFSLTSLCHRVSLLFEVWITCRESRDLLKRSPLPYKAILDHIFETLVDPYYGRNTRPSTFEYGLMHPSQTMEWTLLKAYGRQASLSWTSMAAVAYGCAVGTVARLAMDKIVGREQRALNAMAKAGMTAEMITNLTAAVTTVLLPGAISPATAQTQAVLNRFFEQRLKRANSEDIRSLIELLELVGGGSLRRFTPMTTLWIVNTSTATLDKRSSPPFREPRIAWGLRSWLLGLSALNVPMICCRWFLDVSYSSTRHLSTCSLMTSPRRGS